MPDQNVYRKESKRWVAPKTSYDGDDWGNDEYDEYDTYGEFPEESEGFQPVQRAAFKNIAEESSPTPEVRGTSSAAIDHSKVDPADTPPKEDDQDAVEKPETELDSGTPTLTGQTVPLTKIPPADSNSEAQEASMGGSLHSEAQSKLPAPEEDEAEEELDSSIQDIYGFYENRYSVHPYNAMLTGSQLSSGTPNDFSDSTASLSTGIYSMDSGAAHEPHHTLDTRSSQEYQTELDKVPEVTKETENYDAYPVEDSVPQIKHLQIRKHSRDPSLETEKEFTNNTSQASSLKTGSMDRPVSQVVDEDIAELYQGSSEFLNRPISTYNPLPQRDISDQSIKSLLTPKMEQEGFKATPASPGQEKATVPPLFITSASPDPSLDVQKTPTQESTNSHPSSKDSVPTHDETHGATTASDAADHSTETLAKEQAPTHFEHDLDYVDREQDDGEGTASDDGVSDHDEEPDGESLDTESTPLSESSRGAAEESSLNAPESTDLNAESSSASSKQAESEPLVLGSERRRLQSNPAISVEEGHADSDLTSDTRGHNYRNSEASGNSDATGVTSSSNQDGSLDTESVHTSQSHSGSMSRELAAEATDAATPSPGSTVPTTASSRATVPNSGASPSQVGKSPPQPISAKVKRPPQVDISALLNKSGTSSESRCEQMRILRSREAEYSSGLETWLMATIDQIDPSMKVYANGIPPAGEASSLEIPTTAKVSNAMHSSATNTKEKLGKVGEKSKSFFAKVIR